MFCFQQAAAFETEDKAKKGIFSNFHLMLVQMKVNPQKPNFTVYTKGTNKIKAHCDEL